MRLSTATASGLDLTQLRYFQGIARAGNMTRAARSLRVSQPTVSLAVKHLEASLGTTLFQRHHAGVSLTATGEELLRHVDEVMEVLDRATHRISNLDHRLTGTFSIGSDESFGAYFLPRFLERVLGDAPDVTVSLRNASSQSVLDAVVSREVHFGIVVNPQPHPDVVLTELFCDAIDVFVADPDGAVTDPHGFRFSDLEDARAYFETHPLIHPSGVDGCDRSWYPARVRPLEPPPRGGWRPDEGRLPRGVCIIGHGCPTRLDPYCKRLHRAASGHRPARGEGADPGDIVPGVVTHCHHRVLDELPPPPAKLRCKICHLSISVAELDGGSCPECEESRGERNEDFEPIEDAPPGGTRYRCDDCGLIVDVPVSAPRASSPG